jgi:hypothetical protein
MVSYYNREIAILMWENENEKLVYRKLEKVKDAHLNSLLKYQQEIEPTYKEKINDLN